MSLERAEVCGPKECKEWGEELDMAWIQLSEYHDRKWLEGAQVGSSLNLPKETFYKCAIHKQHGVLEGIFIRY